MNKQQIKNLKTALQNHEVHYYFPEDGSAARVIEVGKYGVVMEHGNFRFRNLNAKNFRKVVDLAL